MLQFAHGLTGWMSTLNTSNHCAVLGKPITHSRSPQLHLAAYSVLGLDWTYDRIEQDERSLESFLNHCDDSWRGLSLTMPLKREAAKLAAQCDAAATQTQAVNTLVPSRDAGRITWLGFNTDVPGLERALRNAGVTTPENALVLGSGATATSAVLSLAQMNTENVTVAARSAERAQPLITFASQLGLTAEFCSLDAVQAKHPFNVAVSTLPSDVEVTFPEALVSAGSVLLDASYDVWPSARASSWQLAGGTAVSGLSMLAEQALLQVRLFVGGSVELPLAHESEVQAAMYRAVGLNAQGL